MPERHTLNDVVQGVDALIEAMVQAAEDDKSALRRFEQVFTLTERSLPDVRLDLKDHATFYRILGWGESGRKAFGNNPSFKPSIEWLNRALPSMRGLGLCPENHPIPESFSDWVELLDYAHAAASHPPPSGSRYSRPLDDPQWRILERSDVVDDVLTRLEETGRVAITGASGVGKTVVSQQVAARLTRVKTYKARPYLFPDERELRLEGYLGLFNEIIRDVAGELATKSLSASRDEAFARDLAQLRIRWDMTKDEEANDPQARRRKEFFEGMGQQPEWGDFVVAVGDHHNHFGPLAFVGDVAELLALGLRDATIVIDDVWDFHHARPVVAPLFGRKPPSGRQSGLKLLVTSQARLALSFLPGADVVELGSEAHATEGLAYDIVSAWSLRETAALTSGDATSKISAFRGDHIDRHEDVRRGIDAVVERVDGNALCLAAIASAWRHEGTAYRPAFWRDACRVIDESPAKLLAFDPNMPHDELVPHRFDNVLAALMFAWSLLDPPMRERYLDLAISPTSELNEELFHLMWERTPRAGVLLEPAMAGHRRPFRIFSGMSLVKTTRDGRYQLHDLHRTMILSQEAGGAMHSRHSEFLRALRLLDDRNCLAIDEEADFSLAPDGSTEFVPRLGADADSFDEGSARSAGRYLVSHLKFHLDQAASSIDERADFHNALFRTFRYLQASVDAGVFAALIPDESEPVTASRIRSAVWQAAIVAKFNKRAFGAHLLLHFTPDDGPADLAFRTSITSNLKQPMLLPAAPFGEFDTYDAAYVWKDHQRRWRLSQPSVLDRFSVGFAWKEVSGRTLIELRKPKPRLFDPLSGLPFQGDEKKFARLEERSADEIAFSTFATEAGEALSHETFHQQRRGWIKKSPGTKIAIYTDRWSISVVRNGELVAELPFMREVILMLPVPSGDTSGIAVFAVLNDGMCGVLRFSG